MIFAEVRGIEVFVGRFEQTERDPVHLWLGIHVGAVEEPILVALEEPGHESGDGGDFSKARPDVDGSRELSQVGRS